MVATLMADFKRTDRVRDRIRTELADILHTRVKDPRIGFVTVTTVELSDDLRHARVAISVFGSPEEKTRTLEGLRAATAFIRGELGRRLALRRVPEIQFLADESLDQLDQIERLLHSPPAGDSEAEPE